jgi:opacity protein-like surface antigen
MKKFTLPLLLISSALLLTSLLFPSMLGAQYKTTTTRHSSSKSAGGRNTIAISLLGSYPGTLSSNAIKQSGSSAAGVLLEYERINNPFFGYNISYGFHGANQNYTNPENIPVSATTKAEAREYNVAWEVSTPTFHVMPVKIFALAGITYQSFTPSAGQINTKDDSKWGTQLGLGFNYTMLPHMGLRAQYRQSRYSAPNINSTVTTVNQSYHQSEPMVGVYFRF